MESRRALLQGMAGLMFSGGLGGCGMLKEWWQPDLAAGTIDVHSHFFNGRDVPVVGFLQQTFLRDPHEPVDPDMIGTAFLKLLKTILLTNTPTAAEELADVTRGAAELSADAAEARDRENVAQALSDYAAGAVPDTAGFSVTRGEESGILDRIAREVDQVAVRESFQTPRQQARVLADEIYAKAGAGAFGTGTRREYRHLSPFVQAIRWAGLLTRARLDILSELHRLYGGKKQVRVFSPSIVDFSYWFKTTENDVESVADQIEVVSAIAGRFRSALVLPFAPFCPLRAALEREADPQRDSLRHVKHAVLNRGFAGVKVYPPMGFRPIGNTADVSEWAKRAPRGGGTALDNELKRLYTWCVANDVPIKAHATDSIDAGQNTGKFAAPEGWQKVLSRPEYHKLRLNLAHFGRFNETAPNARQPAPQDWEDTIADMMDKFPGVYVDLGYWSAALGPEGEDRARIIARMGELLARVPLLEERLMYGSDWSMIGRVPGHQTYSARVVAALEELGFEKARLGAVMGGNAARFLGLTGEGAQHDRLAAFHKDHPIFQEVATS